MEFYGLGRDSEKEDRTGYLLETLTGEAEDWIPFHARSINAGVDVGFGGASTPARRTGDDVPSIETVFDAHDGPRALRRCHVHLVGGFVGL